MSEKSGDESRKVIGLPQALAFGIGGMIGGGVFALSGSIALQSGLSSILVFVIAAITALCSALPYAEFSTVIIKSGGGYSYVNEVFPEFIGFVAGWWFFLAYSLAGAFYAVVFGIYLEILTGLHFYFFSIVLIAIFLFINLIGTKESSASEIALVAFKLGVIVLFILGGFLFVSIDLSNMYWETNPVLIINLVATVFIAFEGFDIISTFSSEARNPTKTIPRAVIISIVTVTTLYILVVLVELSAIFSKLIPTGASPEEIILYAAYRAFGDIGIYLLTAAAIISTMSAYNATLCAVARVGYAMGENKALPRSFRIIHPRFNTPYVSIIASSMIILGVVTLLSIFINRNIISLTLGQLASLAFAFSFALVDLSLIVHRNIHIDLKRNFMTPFYPITPSLGFLTAMIFGIIIALKNLFVMTVFIVLTILGSLTYLFFVKKARSLYSIRNIIGSDLMKAKEALTLKKFLAELKSEK